MRVAKHIQIAREQGAQAGLEAFLAAPVSRQHDSYQEIMSKRKDSTRLQAYCNLFGVSKEPTQPPTTTRVNATRAARVNSGTAVAERPVAQEQAHNPGDIQGDMFKMFQAFLASQGVSAPSVDEDDDEDFEDTPNAAVEDDGDLIEFITHDEAWEALGSDPAFRASKEERRIGPATNGQLFRLNELGLLRIFTDEDEQ